MQAELVVDARANLGEGPVWDRNSQKLYWVDIEECQLHVHEPGGVLDRIYDVGCKVGAAVPRQEGGMILATQNGFETFDFDTQTRTTLVDPESDLKNNRFNDGKCDVRGRFWAGTMSMVREAKAGSLYVLETDHRVRRLFGNVTTSNGLDWSLDLSTMYYIDTPTMMVRAFDYDADEGSISGERIVVQVPEGVGRPDGMTVDAEGMLWVAHWDGGRVTRWNPLDGRLLATVAIPADRVTSSHSAERTSILCSSRRLGMAWTPHSWSHSRRLAACSPCGQAFAGQKPTCSEANSRNSPDVRCSRIRPNRCDRREVPLRTIARETGPNSARPRSEVVSTGGGANSPNQRNRRRTPGPPQRCVPTIQLDRGATRP